MPLDDGLPQVIMFDNLMIEAQLMWVTFQMMLIDLGAAIIISFFFLMSLV